MMMVMMMLSIMMIWWMVDSGRMYGGEVDAKMHWARYYYYTILWSSNIRIIYRT